MMFHVVAIKTIMEIMKELKMRKIMSTKIREEEILGEVPLVQSNNITLILMVIQNGNFLTVEKKGNELK